MSKKTKCKSGAGEEGTDQLRQNYENDTPGQGKDKKMKFKDFVITKIILIKKYFTKELYIFLYIFILYSYYI